MPNWCYNRATFKHENPQFLKRVIRGSEDERLFEEFVPNPSGKWDYNWSLVHWGTKWDTGGEIVSEDRDFVEISFDTAWGPPKEFYERMTELGFEIEAFYFEPGMLFCGRYSSEYGDDYFTIEEYTSEWIVENIPQEIDEAMGISDDASSYEQEND